jgi:3-oxoacyl-[acyl-carrier protein] reductase
VDLGLGNRIAVVTGGSRGIGRAIAHALAREGATVALTYRHDRARAEAVATAIRCGGGEAVAVRLDLGAHSSIRRAFECVLSRWGRIDILVNNAVRWSEHRVVGAPPFEELPLNAWRTPLRSTVEGVYAASQAVLPSMRSQRWGRIVNISAIAANDGMQGAAWYATAKAALHGMTRSLAREVGVDGILVNAVMPGLTLTEHACEFIPQQIQDENALASPIGRLLLPEEVAPVVVFLASAANTAITGDIIRASGGSVVPHRPRAAATRPVVAVIPQASTPAKGPVVRPTTASA